MNIILKDILLTNDYILDILSVNVSISEKWLMFKASVCNH